MSRHRPARQRGQHRHALRAAANHHQLGQVRGRRRKGDRPVRDTDGRRRDQPPPALPRPDPLAAKRQATAEQVARLVELAAARERETTTPGGCSGHPGDGAG